MAWFQKKPNLMQQVFTSMRTELDSIHDCILKQQVAISSLEKRPDPEDQISIVLTAVSTKVREIESKLQDLELWRAKLHAMITETTPRGKEKLNRIGKKFIRRNS